MVDAQPAAENPLQTFHHLNGEGYLGQEVEHLLLTVEGLLDEVDVDFRLTTRGNPVKQGDVLLEEGELYPVKGVLLWGAEGLDVLWMRVATVVQASHLLLIGLKEPTFHERCDRGKGMALVQEFVARDVVARILQILFLVDAGKRKKINEGSPAISSPA